MADQLVSQCSFTYETTNHSDNRTFEHTESVSKQGKATGFQDFTSDLSDITFGDVSSTDIGTMFLVNLSESNTLQYGSTTLASGNLEFRLPPKDWAKVRLGSGLTLKAQTVTGSVKLEKYFLAE